jgi:hypothetical protein
VSSSKASRILKVGAVLAGIGLVGFAAAVASARWTFRVHTYTLASAPGGLSDETNVLRLAESALRLHGADPSAYEPGTFSGGAMVGRNTVDSNRVTTYWIPRLPKTPGLGVALEQHGTNVVCYVARSK